MRETELRGWLRVGFQMFLTAASYNPIRMRNLMTNKNGAHKYERMADRNNYPDITDRASAKAICFPGYIHVRKCIFIHQPAKRRLP